jgi:hypothetical protein
MVMQRSNTWVIGAVLLAMGATGCAKSSTFDNQPAENTTASVKNVNGVEQVTLTPDGARRIGVRTGSIGTSGGRKVIPYAAVLYAANGSTFTFVSPKPRVYHEARIVVERIDGNRAILRRGPAAGTPVVTVGSAELIGTEHGVEQD